MSQDNLSITLTDLSKFDDEVKWVLVTWGTVQFSRVTKFPVFDLTWVSRFYNDLFSLQAAFLADFHNLLSRGLTGSHVAYPRES